MLLPSCKKKGWSDKDSPHSSFQVDQKPYQPCLTALLSFLGGFKQEVILQSIWHCWLTSIFFQKGTAKQCHVAMNCRLWGLKQQAIHQHQLSHPSNTAGTGEQLDPTRWIITAQDVGGCCARRKSGKLKLCFTKFYPDTWRRCPRRMNACKQRFENGYVNRFWPRVFVSYKRLFMNMAGKVFFNFLAQVCGTGV